MRRRDSAESMAVCKLPLNSPLNSNPTFPVKFNQAKALVYHGQFDSSRPGDGQPVTGSDLQAAVDALLNGETMSAVQTPSVGCSIKWNEPLEEA